MSRVAARSDSDPLLEKSAPSEPPMTGERAMTATSVATQARTVRPRRR